MTSLVSFLKEYYCPSSPSFLIINLPTKSKKKRRIHMNSITELLDLEDSDITISDIIIEGQTKTIILETAPTAAPTTALAAIHQTVPVGSFLETGLLLQ